MKNIIIFSSLLLLTIAGSLYCSDDFEGTNEGSGGKQRPFYPSSGSGSRLTHQVGLGLVLTHQMGSGSGKIASSH